MTANPGHTYDQIQKVIELLRGGHGVEAVMTETGIAGRRFFRRWLERHGRHDLWEWAISNDVARGGS